MMEENPLSNRELEILKLIAQGKSNKEIATDLVISVNTVKVHVSNVFQKLNASSRAEAIVYAMEQGLVESPQQEVVEPQIITEIVEAEQPKWLIWFRKYWFIPAIALILIVIGLSFILSKSSLVSKPTPTPNPIQDLIAKNRWQDLESLNPGREGVATVSYRNQIYVIGGQSIEGVSALNQSFNTQTNRWSMHSPKPTPSKDANALLLNGKIYVFGGELKDGTVCDCMEVYDPETNQWEAKSKAPIGLSRYGSVIFEGELYFFGGWDGKELRKDTLIYNPTTNAWKKGVASPIAFADASATLANDRILILGGTRYNEINTSLRVYSINNSSSQTWSEDLEIFEAIEIIGAQNIGDSIVVFSESPEHEIQVSYYSINNETWMHTTEKAPNNLVKGSRLANQSGAVFFIGGRKANNQASNSFIRYQAIFTIMIPAISN